MPLTSTDVRKVTFSKPPIGKRGYNEEEVDAFLDLVGAELARLTEENNGLRNRVAQLDRQLRAAPIETGRNLRPIQLPQTVMSPAVGALTREQASPGRDHDTQAAKVLRLAQQIADRLTGEARADADGLLGEARTKSEQLLSDARVKADGMVHEARTRARTILDDARAQAETLDRQAREKATSLERDAVRKHDEVIGSISQEKSVLEKKVAELRTFEREYRTRLKTYLEVQLRELDSRASAVPADSARTPDFMTSGIGAHTEATSYRPDPELGVPGADVPRIPVQTGPRDKEIIGESHLHEIRWEPAV